MTGLIILAAGSSSRLGKPKQTLLYKGKSLLLYAVENGLNANCKPVVLVLGAYQAIAFPRIPDTALQIVINEQWKTGMASSINCGLSALLETEPNLQNCILMLCDQPFVDTALLNTLITENETTGKNIIGSSYSNTIGTPALFSKKYFQQLLSLKGQEGAKRLIVENENDTASVSFPKGKIDIDTIQDYEGLIGSN